MGHDNTQTTERGIKQRQSTDQEGRIKKEKWNMECRQRR